MAIIIRPNGGFNNAMTGLAAGFQQGMEFALKKEQIDIQRMLAEEQAKKAKSEAEYRTGMLDIAQSGEQRQQTVFGQQQAEGQAFANMVSGMASVDAMQPELDQRSAERAAAPYATPPQKQSIYGVPQTSFADSYLQRVGGPVSERDVAAAGQYSDQMKALRSAASGITDPAKQSVFLKWMEGKIEQQADRTRRESFGAEIADRVSRGAYTFLDNTGQPIDDPDMVGRVKMLTDALGDPRVPLQTIRQMEQELTNAVVAHNKDARSFADNLNLITGYKQRALSMGAEGRNISAALGGVEDLMRQGLKGEKLSKAIDYANRGLIEAPLMDGSTIVVPYDQAKQQADAANKRIIDLQNVQGLLRQAQSAYYFNRGTGTQQTDTPADQEKTLTSLWNQSGEEEQDRIRKSWPSTHDGKEFTLEAWKEEQRARLYPGSAAPAGRPAPATPQPAFDLGDAISKMPSNQKEMFMRSLVDSGVMNPDGTFSDKIPPEERTRFYTMAAFQALGAKIEPNAQGETVLTLPDGRQIINPTFSPRKNK